MKNRFFQFEQTKSVLLQNFFKKKFDDTINAFSNIPQQLLDRIALNEKNRINAIRSMLKEARSDRDRISNKVI